MDQAILKKLLSNEFYNENRAKLKRALFAEEGADLFDVIEQAHSKYGHDLSIKEVMILYKIHNPISSEAEIGVVTDVITSIGNAQDISDGVAQDAIIDLWKRENARQIADLAISVTEGNYDAMKVMAETKGLSENRPHIPYSYTILIIMIYFGSKFGSKYGCNFCRYCY